MQTPLNPQDFFVAGGTLWSEASSYITRPMDAELFELTRAGEYCNILAARQMGKSSLMVRTAGRLREAGVRTAIIDISTLGGGISTPEAWFYGFVDELALQLGLDADVEGWWETHTAHNAVQRFSNFLRDVVLAELKDPIVVFVDEIDSALGMAFTDDFFAAIRAAFNARAVHPEFQRLTFVLIGVARPADLIRDRIRTPYNIGTHVALSDFTLEELEPFQAALEAAYPGQGADLVRWVLHWTSGQPYLTQKLCAELAGLAPAPMTEAAVEETVTRLFFTDRAQKESNLRSIRDRVESSPHKIRMLEIYRDILRGRSVPDEERSVEKNELKLSGLVGAEGDGRLSVRNRTYRKVFDEEWVRRNLPVSRTRQFAVAAGLLALAAILVAAWAIYSSRVQASRTFEEQFLASSSPDVRLVSLARLLELDERGAEAAAGLFNGLSPAEQAGLFTGLSDPGNVGDELVAVVEAFYQPLGDTAAGEPVLEAIRDVVGQVGAAGAPSLKTELEFWLKGREEAAEDGSFQIAVSLFDSAWAESETRGHPNFRVRYDRALALAALGEHALAMDDLRAVVAEGIITAERAAAVINADAALAFYFGTHQADFPAFAGLITPAAPTPTGAPTAVAGAPPTGTASPEPATPTTVPVEGGEPVAAAVSPYAGWIAYAEGQGGGREIVLFDPETGERRQITSNAFTDEAPSFSPDNWQLVYASNRGADGWGLYVYDLAAGVEIRLADFEGEARFPSWSPALGDARIAFEGRTGEAEGTNIWVLDAGVGAFEQVTTGGADSRPAWSPDGAQIAFGRATADTTGDGTISTSDNQDLYVLHVATGALTNLTATPAEDDFNFAWSPDGAWIAYTSARSDANGDGAQNLDDSRDLHLVRPDGTGGATLPLGDAAIYSPSWTPDGAAILALFVPPDGENELRLVDAESGEAGPALVQGVVFHPASAHAEVEPAPVVRDLAFVSDRDGQYGVYLMQAGRLDTWQALPRPAGYERAWWPTFCGDYVAYEAQDLTGLDPQWIYLYSPDVSEPIRYRSSLDPAELGVPRCSPNGDLMAFSVYLPDDAAGWRVAVNDTAASVEYLPQGVPGFGYVTWSNRADFFLSMTIIDGDFFVLSSANFAGTPSLATLARGKYPALSPNGNRFVYLCSNQAYLCIQDVDGGSPELLVEVVSIRLAGEDVPVTAMWSADGTWIYFASAADGDWDIYRIRPNGTGLQNLTAGWDSNELMPAVDQGN